MKLIDKDKVVEKIRIYKRNAELYLEHHRDENSKLRHSFEMEKNVMCELLSFLDTLEVKDGDLELKIDNNKPKITVGTKIRSKTNPDVILNIISNDCHEDEFECSNGSVLSLKQIEKYYDIYIEEK